MTPHVDVTGTCHVAPKRIPQAMRARALPTLSCLGTACGEIYPSVHCCLMGHANPPLQTCTAPSADTSHLSGDLSSLAKLSCAPPHQSQESARMWPPCDAGSGHRQTCASRSPTTPLIACVFWRPLPSTLQRQSPIHPDVFTAGLLAIRHP